jgi:hypothetical protein
MQHRVIRGRVVFGKLDTVFIRVRDDFVPKGASCLIEVVRQTLLDVGEYLAVNGWEIPRILYFQADNR